MECSLHLDLERLYLPTQFALCFQINGPRSRDSIRAISVTRQVQKKGCKPRNAKFGVRTIAIIKRKNKQQNQATEHPSPGCFKV